MRKITIDNFTSAVRDITERVHSAKGKICISDLKDEKDIQYIDLVQESRGVWGIALVGFTYILEMAGIRFLSLAGTSAGSINTLLMASLGKPHVAKSKVILKHLVKQKFFDFIDGGSDAKALIKA